MTFYEDLVMQTQANYSRYHSVYAAGDTPYALTERAPLPYAEQIDRFARELAEADCVVVGGASGLSAAGGGDFYYADNASFRKYFGRFAEKYHFQGAFDGMFRQWDDRAAFWGYLATFLHTTQTAPVRDPYLDLDALLKGKDFFILTTNQDTQFVKLYPEETVAEIQGDHRFFQCAALLHRRNLGRGEACGGDDSRHGRRHRHPGVHDPPLPPLRWGGVPLGAGIRELSSGSEV